MVGITSIGAYIPLYRLSREQIGGMWQTKGGAGDKAVAGYDEDVVTMGVAAALECIKKKGDGIKALYFATTTAPYREKQAAAIIAAALDLDKWSHTVEFANSLRAGTSALKVAADAVESGSAEQVLLIASDCRVGAPKGKFEQTLGDGAVAMTIGAKEPIAVIEGSRSLFSDFTAFWRTDCDDFPQSAEARLIVRGGIPTHHAGGRLGAHEKIRLKAGDFSKVVFSAHEGKEHADLARGSASTNRRSRTTSSAV